MKSPIAKTVTAVLLLMFGVLAISGITAVVVSAMGDDDTQDATASPANSQVASQVALSAAAEPYRQDLEQAAQQCPTVLTAQRLDRLIDYTTGWDPAPGEFGPLPLSAAGLTEGQHEQGGGGDPSDVPTAINAAATLWCEHAEVLRSQNIHIAVPLPDPARADDDMEAAALGLAAIYAGRDMILNHGVNSIYLPSMEQDLNAVL